MGIRPTVSQLRNMTDFNQMIKWGLDIVTPPSGVAGFPDSAEWNLRCLTSELPKRTGTPIDLKIRGIGIHRPGTYDYSPSITIQFVETIDNIIFNGLEAWLEACWQSDTGISQPAGNLLAIVALTMLDRLDTPNKRYTLLGCWPLDFDHGGTLMNEGPDIWKPSIVLSYDDYVPETLS